jgi:hypothetical protein
MRARHGHSNGERNKRGDDHSDSNCPEPTSKPALGSFGWAIATFWIRRAITLALAAGTPRFQSTQSSFESRIVSAYASGLVGDGEIAEKR